MKLSYFFASITRKHEVNNKQYKKNEIPPAPLIVIVEGIEMFGNLVWHLSYCFRKYPDIAQKRRHPQKKKEEAKLLRKCSIGTKKHPTYVQVEKMSNPQFSL